EDRPWKFDDISSMAHSELERHREARHYARVAAYEMPRLAQLAKPFVPPTKSQPLRFRYTTYMGEQHPAQSKVVLEFAPLDLPLEPIQRSKLIKLVGPRYNPDKKIVKMSSEMFPNPAQNKRYLSDIFDRLLIEARDSTDTYEDVPFDFRHHKAKPMKPKLPKEWVE
ncbi:mitochondrial ribosomal subunit protein-domain-containing protein, partial [Geopyxis carbonaria]